jgi:hypothetical protein
MKHIRPTAIMLSGLLCLAEISCAQILGDPIYYFDFANGIPADWQNFSAGGISQWEYRGPGTTPGSAVGSRGSCSAGSVPIASLTQPNGFVIFDSNYWDDDDNECGGLGTGQHPAPHNASLTTGTLNFTGYTTLVLTFQQQFKHYITTTKVQLSNDNGNTWSDIMTNTGAFSAAGEWKTINISAAAANQNDVKIRFLFTGTYYWWLLDDIAIYSPNPNDLMLTEPRYTLFGVPGQALEYMADLPYDQYPSVMIPPFKFSGRATNIGGNSQTQCNLNVQVKKGTTTYYNSTSPNSTISAGANNVIQLATSFINPVITGDYLVTYNLDQLQTDDNVTDNLDTLDYSISPYAYARDEGPMEDVFVPSTLYQGQVTQVGNVFQARAGNLRCQSLGVALGTGTAIGSQVYGVIYKHDLQTVLATSLPYTVNVADLNTPGEEKMVTLYFENPLLLTLDSMYVAMVSNTSGDQNLRVARSGSAITESSFVKYPQSNGLFFLLKSPIVRMNIFNASTTGGCTDPAAMNYQPAANLNDGSCDYPGCTNAGADNYNPAANWDDGSCALYGCTLPEADNYDPLATVDNGTCVLSGCTNPNADNYVPGANNEDGSCIFSGCTESGAANYDPGANVNDGSCLYPGCTDTGADNYDPEANTDNGSCQYFGCTQPNADNYDPTANADDGTCIISGCTDPDADNYDNSANNDDGSCVYLGCTDPQAANYDAAATVEDGSCLYPGCTDSLANNFDAGANADDGSCLYSFAMFTLNADTVCVPATVVVSNQTDYSGEGQCVLSDNAGNQFSACAETYTLAYEEPGTYIITLAYVQSTEMSLYTDTVVVVPLPAAPVLAYDAGPPAQVLADDAAAGTFAWWVDGVLVATTETAALVISDNGLVDNGYYRLHYTNLLGCAAWSDSLLVLEPQFYAVEDSLCQGGVFTFINQTDPVGGANCSWLSGGTLSCEPGANLLDAAEPGSFSIGLQYSVGEQVFGPVFTTAVVLPVPSPPALAYDAGPPAQVFTGDYTDGTFAWWLDGMPIATSDTAALAISDNGLVDNGYYRLHYTNTFGCEAWSDSLVVLEPQFFVVQDSLCQGGVFAFINQTDPVEGAQCAWLPNGLLSCEPGSNMLNAGEPGSLSIGLQYTLGELVFGPLYTDVVVVANPPAPALTEDAGIPGLVCSGCGGYTVNWYDADGVLVQSGDTVFTEGIHPTAYYVAIENAFGCSALSNNAGFPTALDEANPLMKLNLYPNPARQLLTLEATAPLGQVVVRDTAGKTVLTGFYAGTRATLNIDSLSGGIYAVSCAAGTQRLVIAR